MTPDPITTARDHFFLLKVFVPSKVTCTEERIRWYFDHAIRGYHRQFALDTDPIKGMSDSSTTIDKIPLKEFNGQKAEIEKLKAERDEAQLGLEVWRGKTVDARTKNRELTSQLEQAEKVIEPFGKAYRAITINGHTGYAIGPTKQDDYAAASQWIKDRQAKGER